MYDPQPSGRVAGAKAIRLSPALNQFHLHGGSHA
jgi:hypothetical protein